MSNLRKTSGYTISAASVAAAIAITADRYGEFVAGSESLASWALPPFALIAIAVAGFASAKLGHPTEGESDA